MANVDDIQPLKGKKRKLSQFLCEEMLYDYATENLDDARRESVEDFLKSSSETQKILSDLEAGMKYCSSLGKTQVAEPLIQKLLYSKAWYQWVSETIAWEKWPEATRWTLEAFIISSLAAFIIALAWPKVSHWLPERSKDIILAKVDKTKEKETSINIPQPETKIPEVPTVLPLASDQSTTVQSTIVSSEKKEVSIAASEASNSQSSKESSLKINIKETNTSEGETKPSQMAIATVAAKNTDEEDEVEGKTETKVEKPVVKPAPKGFIYRAFMSLNSLDAVTNEIRDNLVGLGGEKAGEVPMGWRKPKSSYFHFSLPEVNYEKAVEMLRSFGPVRIYKDPHWRVMPEGKIRIILTIEDLDLKNKSE
ncbi:MAG: hypothetical protein KDD34_01110 [Bdellovibrionales bacterium]|nr:hypothetical protein [Bdellovibrionales bacterium]